MILFNFYGIFTIALTISFVSNGNSQRSSVFKDSGISPKDSSALNGGSNNKKFLELVEEIKKVESQIEAERSLRSNLEQRITNISNLSENNSKQLSALSDTVQTVKLSVESDSNFWNSSETCGGVVISQFGKLSYSHTMSSTMSRFVQVRRKQTCIWTVRVNNRPKIKLTVSMLPLLAVNGYVTEFFIEKNGTHTTKVTSIYPTKTYIFNGPVIIVSMQLRSGTTATSGSSTVVFEGLGMLVEQDTEFHHFHYRKLIGSFNLLNQSNSATQSLITRKKKIFTTVVINSEVSNLVELKLEPLNCLNSTLAMQRNWDSEPALNPEKLQSCCSGDTCPEETFYTLDGWFTTSFSTLKSSENQNLKMSWDTRQRQFNQSSSTDICGGVLTGNSGKISYKRNSNYHNNERCVWVLYPFPRSAVRVSNMFNGMESTYDHLVVTEIDSDNPKSTELHSQSVQYYHAPATNFTGRVVLIMFYSDSSIVRQGFELIWEGIGPIDHSRRLENEHIMHKSSESNFITINREASPSKGFSFYLLSTLEHDGSSLTIQLSNFKDQTDLNCSLTVKMFGSQGGHIGDFYQKTQPSCNSSSNFESLRSPDGIVSVLLDVEAPGIKQNVSLELVTEQHPPAPIEATIDRCGGVLHSMTGRLTYKLEEAYLNNERCIWILYTPLSAQIELKLLKDGFEDCCDYIIVNTINPETGKLNLATTVITRENNTKIFRGPILVISFRTDSSVVGKGFSLQYTGRGTLNDDPYTYHVIHRDEHSGSFEYPQLDHTYWDNGNGLYGEDDILVVAYSNAAEPVGTVASVNFNATIENVVLGMDEHCNSDSLNFYSSPSREGFSLVESYPKKRCHPAHEGNCHECISQEVELNDTQHDAFGSPFKAFLAIYKPVKSDFYNQSFHANWEIASGCGGVLVESSGTISYKSYAKYKNSEQCVWIVHAPLAGRITFNLQSNGFELCCDYIILNSLDATNGRLGPREILSGDRKMITMDGPVVFVTFRSDGSVTGEGFMLSFARISLEPTGPAAAFDFHLEHKRRRNYSLSFPTVGSLVEMKKDSILAFAFSPESGRNETYLRHGTKISIVLLHLGFDNETCVSDSLSFFETPTRLGYNVTKSYEVALPRNGFCNATSAINDSVVCSNCPDDDNEQYSIFSNQTAFIAILKSNSDTDKAFMISWSDIERGV